MKKVLSFLFFAALTLGLSAQTKAKKPRLMVIPADTWCTNHGYMTTEEVNGESVSIPDYVAALQKETDLKLAISKIGHLMSEQGFNLEDLEKTVKSVNANRAEDALIRGKNDEKVQESAYDQYLRQARPDILLSLDYRVNTAGPKKSVTYILQAIDAYSNKQVASSEGTGPQSFSAEVPVLIEEAVVSRMDQFTSQLQTHFDDMFTNGREVRVELRTTDEDLTFEDMYGDKELSEVIEEWFDQNCVNHSFSLDDVTENQMQFSQVRIPMFKTNGTSALDTRGFSNNLSKVLKAAPYGLKVRLTKVSLGRCTLLLSK